MTTLKSPISPEDHVQGSELAGITLVEYGDYGCTSCNQARLMIKKLQSHFGEDFRFVFRHFPLTELHPFAEIAAEAAEFAANRNLFWQMHDLLYENQKELSLIRILELANNLGLPVDELDQSIKNNMHRMKIQNDFMNGVKSGVNGTPTFFINGLRYNGFFNFESLLLRIEQEAEHK